MTRRDLITRVPLILLAKRMPAQAPFNQGYDTLVVQTTQTTAWNPIINRVGSSVAFYWKFPDGTYYSGQTPSKNFAAGTKTVIIQSQSGLKAMTGFQFGSKNMVGTLPNLSRCGASITQINAFGNAYTGGIPTYYGSQFTAMTTFDVHTNSLSGTIPSFAAATLITNFLVYGNSLTGTVPSFAACTKLVAARFEANSGINGTTAGSWATQKSLNNLNFNGCALPSAAVNQILADCVTSLSVGGRVTCTVDLSAGTNGAPTGTGITNKGTLIAAGWTVTTN